MDCMQYFAPGFPYKIVGYQKQLQKTLANSGGEVHISFFFESGQESPMAGDGGRARRGSFEKFRRPDRKDP